MNSSPKFRFPYAHYARVIPDVRRRDEYIRRCAFLNRCPAVHIYDQVMTLRAGDTVNVGR